MIRSIMLLFVTGLCLVALAIGAPSAASAMAKGWLVAFLIFAGAPIGSIALLLIHRLTGGRWGRDLEAPLLAAAGLMPLVALAFAPVALTMGLVYPWVLSPERLPLGLGLYLNFPLFLLRACIGLGFWWLCAIALARGGPGRLWAAAALVFHALAVSILSYDWILSLDPGFGSTAFGAMIAFEQILTALCVAAIVAWRRGQRAANGLGGWMIATLLGIFYLQLISFIVDWYGNLPDKAAHYLDRASLPWLIVLVGSIVVGALAPLGILLREKGRAHAGALAVAGAFCLTGIALHVAWLVAPSAGALWIAAMLIAMLALVCAALALTRLSPFMPLGRARDVG